MPSFETPDPVTLTVDVPAGALRIDADSTGTSSVELRPARSGDSDAEALVALSRVEHRGDEIVVHVPDEKHGRFRRTPEVVVEIRVPFGSRLVAHTGSADVTVTGELGNTKIGTGSGDVSLTDVDGSLEVESGSGDVRVGSVARDATIKTSSGDVTVETCCDTSKIHTASGDVQVGTAEAMLDARTASGDVEVAGAEGPVVVRTASGDVDLRRVRGDDVAITSASGDVRVGVEPGISVWMDVSSLSGSVSSDLDPSEERSADQPTLQLRAQTVSGDVQIRRV